MGKKASWQKFVGGQINLLLKEEKSEIWRKIKKIIKTTSLISSLVFILMALFTFFYSLSVSSYGEKLEKRANQARRKISSLQKEEKIYLSLIKKLKSAQKILASRPNMAQVLEKIDSFFPQEITLYSLQVTKDGQTNVQLSSPSLSKIEELNQNLNQAIAKGEIAEVAIGGVSKEKDFYKLTISFQLKQDEK